MKKNDEEISDSEKVEEPVEEPVKEKENLDDAEKHRGIIDWIHDKLVGDGVDKGVAKKELKLNKKFIKDIEEDKKLNGKKAVEEKPKEELVEEEKIEEKKPKEDGGREIEGNADLETRTLKIRLQKNPHKVRDQILEGLPMYEQLKSAVRNL